MTQSEWTPTKHGGLRRITPNAGSLEDVAPEEASSEAEAIASAEVKGDGETGGTRIGRRGEISESWVRIPARVPRFILKFNERLGLPDCPYAIRWRFETQWGSVRLHRWLGHDDPRYVHDHAWDFVTFVLRGGYYDVSPEGNEHLRAPTTRYRKATHQHTVYPDADGAWTVIVTGPKLRNYGFWVKGKFRKANKYFLTYGHHPCD